MVTIVRDDIVGGGWEVTWQILFSWETELENIENQLSPGFWQIAHIQDDQLYMAVFFWYLVNRDIV